jgi:hypothetical protein
MAAGGTYRGNRGGRLNTCGRGRGRGTSGRRPQSTSAHAAQQHCTITCYKCGETGHIATSCPTNTGRMPTSGSVPGPATSGQRHSFTDARTRAWSTTLRYPNNRGLLSSSTVILLLSSFNSSQPFTFLI